MKIERGRGAIYPPPTWMAAPTRAQSCGNVAVPLRDPGLSKLPQGIRDESLQRGRKTVAHGLNRGLHVAPIAAAPKVAKEFTLDA